MKMSDLTEHVLNNNRRRSKYNYMSYVANK